MADERFEPGRYVHGLDGAPVVVVPAGVAALLAARLDLDALRLELRDLREPEAAAVLVALAAAAKAWRSRAGSDIGTPVDVRDSDGGSSTSSRTITTAEAFGLLGLGGRGLRRAAEKGQIRGRLAGGVWLLNQDDVEELAARRRGRD